MDREERARLFRGWTGVQTNAYLRVSYQGARPKDSMDQMYRDRRPTEVGTGYPVPPPKPLEDQEPPLTGKANSDEEGDDSAEGSQDRGSYDDPGDADGEHDTEAEEDKGAAAPTSVVRLSQPVASSSLQKPLPNPAPCQSADGGRQSTPNSAGGTSRDGEQMYVPEKPTGDPHSEAPGPEKSGGDTDRTGEASSMWLPGPFKAQLRLWGFNQVDGGQRNEAGIKGPCFFVAVREAMVVAREGYASTALRMDVQRQLALPRWSLMADAMRAGAEGLPVREDYRSPIFGSADPARVDFTWPAFVETNSNPWWPSCWAAPYC